MYFGTDRRGVPPREDCPAATWGYPCFRDGAIPIVVMFTDAQFHNGPDNNDFRYDNGRPRHHRRHAATSYYPVRQHQRGLRRSVADLGDLTSSFKTFTGDTSDDARGPAERSIFSCLSNSDGNDAVFQLQPDAAAGGQDREHRFAVRHRARAVHRRARRRRPYSARQRQHQRESAASAYDFGEVYDKYLVHARQHRRR